LANQLAQTVDTLIVDDVRNFLFGNPGEGGFDLASLNIQRGRDHGLANYNQARVDYGLAPVTSFAEITSNPELQEKLAATYSSVDDIDGWVGGLAEDHVPGALVGELVRAVLTDQFEALRNGDRFWYENVLSPPTVRFVNRQTLSVIIKRNTGIGKELKKNVFKVFKQATKGH
jgi:peroxidase